MMNPFDDSNPELDSSDFESDKVKKPKCNWCNRHKELLPNTKHCSECDKKAYRLCSRCHRPFNSPSYFTLDSKRCDSCQRKYIREREKREQKKRQLDNDDAPTPEKKLRTVTENHEIKKNVEQASTSHREADRPISLENMMFQNGLPERQTISNMSLKLLAIPIYLMTDDTTQPPKTV